MFEPSIFGTDQAGIIELIEDILKHYDTETRNKLISNIYVTGGFSLTKNFDTRLEKELRCIVDPDLPVVVQYSDDPLSDAWKGAAMFCKEEEVERITAKDYEEKGM